MYYRTYSDYLKTKYGEKVYKLPVNLPISCPNRMNGNQGCSFCADVGTGFEAMSSGMSVTEQLNKTKEKISRRYKAKKFIAYFQNYTNTFMSLERFRAYITEAAKVEDIVEISISTRPDCIKKEYLDFLKQIRREYQIEIHFELGLQTVNYHTLKNINRGHGLAEFIQAVMQVQASISPFPNLIIITKLGKNFFSLSSNITTSYSYSWFNSSIKKFHYYCILSILINPSKLVPS